MEIIVLTKTELRKPISKRRRKPETKKTAIYFNDPCEPWSGRDYFRHLQIRGAGNHAGSFAPSARPIEF